MQSVLRGFHENLAQFRSALTCRPGDIILLTKINRLKMDLEHIEKRFNEACDVIGQYYKEKGIIIKSIMKDTPEITPQNNGGPRHRH